jgi:hypothetical protein
MGYTIAPVMMALLLAGCGYIVPSYARYAIDFGCVPVGPADRRAL